jgi:hypothetical protein
MIDVLHVRLDELLGLRAVRRELAARFEEIEREARFLCAPFRVVQTRRSKDAASVSLAAEAIRSTRT